MKTILLLLIGFAGAFVAVTHTDDVLAPISRLSRISYR